MSFVLWSPAGAQARPTDAAVGGYLSAAGTGVAELSALGAELGRPEQARRLRAVERLRSLRPESLQAIEQRLDALLSRSREPEATREAFHALRRAAGSRRADDDADLLEGVAVVLSERTDGAVLGVVEPLLLLRSLAGMASPEAGRVMARFVTLDDGLWRNEMRLLRGRAGMALLPGLVVLRSHPESAVRKWAQYGVRVLGFAEPAALAELEDTPMLSRLVLAYSDPLDFAAMPTLVRLVDHDSPEVRRAARTAVARFGKNAIWQLRELYEELAGERADKGWDHQQAADELYAVIDRERHAELQKLLERGMASFVDGQLDDMARAYDMLLARDPDFADRAKLAAGYAALGAHRLKLDELHGARAAYARALRLSPGAAEAAHWRAQREFASAERALSRGLLDLSAYERARTLQPEHEAANAALDLLSGARTERQRRTKRLAAAGAAALLLLLAFTLWRGSRADHPTAAGETA